MTEQQQEQQAIGDQDSAGGFDILLALLAAVGCTIGYWLVCDHIDGLRVQYDALNVELPALTILCLDIAARRLLFAPLFFLVLAIPMLSVCLLASRRSLRVLATLLTTIVAVIFMAGMIAFADLPMRRLSRALNEQPKAQTANPGKR